MCNPLARKRGLLSRMKAMKPEQAKMSGFKVFVGWNLLFPVFEGASAPSQR